MKARLAKICPLLPFAIYSILLAFTLSPLSAKENNRISVKNLYGKFAYAEYYPIDSQYNESIKNRFDFLSRFDDWNKIIIKEDLFRSPLATVENPRYSLLEINEDKTFPYSSRGSYVSSDFLGILPNKRIFNQVLSVNSGVDIVEVLNYDEILIFAENAYLLYKRVR